MKKNKEKSEKIVKKVISAMVDKETREWPPTCLAFIYQPVRPHSISSKKRNK